MPSVFAGPHLRSDAAFTQDLGLDKGKSGACSCWSAKVNKIVIVWPFLSFVLQGREVLIILVSCYIVMSQAKKTMKP